VVYRGIDTSQAMLELGRELTAFDRGQSEVLDYLAVPSVPLRNQYSASSTPRLRAFGRRSEARPPAVFIPDCLLLLQRRPG
jgi:hypothetical protein